MIVFNLFAAWLNETLFNFKFSPLFFLFCLFLAQESAKNDNNKPQGKMLFIIPQSLPPKSVVCYFEFSYLHTACPYSYYPSPCTPEIVSTFNSFLRTAI